MLKQTRNAKKNKKYLKKPTTMLEFGSFANKRL